MKCTNLAQRVYSAAKPTNTYPVQRRRTKALAVLISAALATPALATTYYVSPTGSDSNSGTNPNAPWGSVAKVDTATFKPGDQILFQYGSNWNASLDATSSGSTNAPIVYGAYGNPKLGNPTFYGSDPISPSAFSLVSGTTYVTTTTTPVNWVFNNHQFSLEAQDTLGNGPTPAASLAYVQSYPNSFYYNSSNGQLFVNVGSAPKGLTLATRADAIFSNGQNNLRFQNLNVSETAQDNAGYGIRIENSSNVSVLNSTITNSGKHGVGVIDSTAFNGTNLVANGTAPYQGFGGASAFVAFGDSTSTIGTNDTSKWTNISYVNSNGPYEVFVSHGGTSGIANITINNVVSTGGYGTGFTIYSTSDAESVLINGGHLDNNNNEIDTSNTVFNGVTVSGTNSSLFMPGSNSTIQNSTFIGALAYPGDGKNGVVQVEGNNATVRFNTFDIAPYAGPAVGILNSSTTAKVYGNIFAPTAGPIIPEWPLFDGSFVLSSNQNLLDTGDSYQVGSFSDAHVVLIAQWQAMGYDVNSVIGDAVYTDQPDGIYMLQAGSPGIGIYNNPLDPSLTLANSFVSSSNANGSYNAGLNPSIWPNMNSLPGALVLNNGQTNVITPQGNTLTLTSAGSITVMAGSGLDISGNVANSGAFIISGDLIATGNFNNSGSVVIAGSQIWSPGTVFTNLAGAATFQTDAGGSIAPEEYLAVNVSGGSVTFTSTQHLTSLAVAAGAKVQLNNIAGAGRSVLFTPSLAVTGILDLTGNDLVVENGSVAAVTAMVQSGFAGGRWNGSGIVSSTAATSSMHLTTVGVILNTADGVNPLYASGAALGLFDGTNPGPSDVLVKYTYFGDANLDGTVDGNDYTRIDNGFNMHLTGWYNGDFNYDGVVNGSDYTLIDNAFNMQSTSLGAKITTELAPSVSAVPEPAVLSVLSLAGSFLLRRRGRASQSVRTGRTS
jgi:hypothetical protein